MTSHSEKHIPKAMIKLREFEINDRLSLVRILNIPDVTKYLSSKIPAPYTEEDAKWWITTGSKEGIIRAIEYNNELVGCIGVTRGEFEYSRSGEIGYWIAHEHWRKGIATQAINNIVSYTFEQTNMIRLFAAVFCENLASKGALEKCGFKPEAILKKAIFKNNTLYNNHIFSKLKDDK